MKIILFIALCIGVAASAPASDSSSSESGSSENNEVVVTSKFFPTEFVVHTAEHDILQILVPLNSLNFDEHDDDDTDQDRSTVFFVEGDVNNGVKEYKGISVIHSGVVKKILETGTDASAANDDTKTAFFSATDGLYKYNDATQTAEKFGTVNDNLIAIAKANNSDTIYVLTNNNEVYKVTEEGTKKVKVDNVVGAKQIVLDYSDNLFYFGQDKQPYVLTEDGVKKIEGLPSNITEIDLIKPPFVIDDGVPAIIDNKAYIIYANGTSEVTDFKFEVKPTAYSMEATLVQYYGYDKKIYQYNILAMLLSEVIEELKNFLSVNTNEIRSISQRVRQEIKN